MRRRIRLQIGRNGLLYLAIGVLLLTVAVGTQANLLFWVFGLMVGGVIVSLAIPLLTLRSITIKRLLPDHCSVDEPIHLRYEVTNHSRIFPVFGMVVIEHTNHRKQKADKHHARLSGNPYGWMLHIGPKQVGQAQATGWPNKRGELHLNRFSISTAFPFGIIKCVKIFHQPDQMLVYPRLYNVNRKILYQLSSTYLHGKQQRMTGGGQDEFFGLREYRAGDPIKLVDWKHSAKIGRWISRELTQPAQPKIMIALDLSNQVLENPTVTDESIEKAISLTASLICDAHVRGYEYGMLIRGSNHPAFRIHRSLNHREDMLETLTRFDSQGKAQDVDDRQIKLAIEPTVVITPANVTSRFSRSGKITLSAARLEQIVDPSAIDSRLLLTDTTPANLYYSHAAGID